MQPQGIRVNTVLLRTPVTASRAYAERWKGPRGLGRRVRTRSRHASLARLYLDRVGICIALATATFDISASKISFSELQVKFKF